MQTQQQLLLVAGIVARMDLDGFLRAVNHAETVGPFLDATLYMQGSSRLGAIKRIATAAQQLQKVTAEVKEELADEVLPR
ncbi:MAG TPA: hypothetical protein GX506_00345 [Firmicutes bacterium]|nr:hypothetical protein [Bacillota bacterium]